MLAINKIFTTVANYNIMDFNRLLFQTMERNVAINTRVLELPISLLQNYEQK